MVDINDVLTDLADESAEVDALVAPLSDVDWTRPTPAVGWMIAHQIAHLAWTDHITYVAVAEPDVFVASVPDFDEGYVDRGAVEFLAPPAELLDRWRTGRRTLSDALRAVPPGTRLPWYGTSMAAPSMATARIMETWAHGLDVAEALGVARRPTARLRHIAHLGTRTIANGFLVQGRDAPTEPVRVELAAPDGSLWTFGPEDAKNRLVGPAVDFCLLVTRRRHRADLALVATGPVADEWLEVAQVFVGPPGPDRDPGR